MKSHQMGQEWDVFYLIPLNSTFRCDILLLLCIENDTYSLSLSIIDIDKNYRFAAPYC